MTVNISQLQPFDSCDFFKHNDLIFVKLTNSSLLSAFIPQVTNAQFLKKNRSPGKRIKASNALPNEWDPCKWAGMGWQRFQGPHKREQRDNTRLTKLTVKV